MPGLQAKTVRDTFGTHSRVYGGRRSIECRTRGQRGTLLRISQRPHCVVRLIMCIQPPDTFHVRCQANCNVECFNARNKVPSSHVCSIYSSSRNNSDLDYTEGWSGKDSLVAFVFIERPLVSYRLNDSSHIGPSQFQFFGVFLARVRMRGKKRERQKEPCFGCIS